MAADTPTPKLASLEENSEWFSHQNLSAYRGYWVAVVNRQLVAKDHDLGVVIKAARAKAPGATPFIASVPEGILAV